MEGKFWMCYVERSAGCRYIHHDLEEARIEAERLSKLRGNEDKRVYIMESTQCCYIEYPPVVWYKL